MLLKYFYDKHLAQASYLLGCQQTGEAIVIDPARDVTPYLQTAQESGLRIVCVTETHIHADFVSGARELSAISGGELRLSAMGSDDWQYRFPASPLFDGDTFMVGNVRLEALHTPGHTPEHLVFVFTDTTAADRPMGILTGDFLFVGDVGRPDLLEEAAGIANTRVLGARQQFYNVQRFKSLPDYLQILPGHGAGSACGKALGAVPSSTLGYEKLFNPAFQIDDEDDFVRWLLDGQPEAPRYFGQMKQVNRDGAVLLADLFEPLCLDPTLLPEILNMRALMIDTRPAKAFARAHIPTTLCIPANENSFSTWVGWYVDYRQPTYLIADPDDVPRILTMLRAIGVDNIPGYFTPDVAEQHSAQIEQITAKHVQSGQYILDVRSKSEYDEAHIPGAHHVPMGYVPQRLNELPRGEKIIVQCGSGVRSMVVASLLQTQGFAVVNLVGGIEAWKKANLPVEKSV